MACRGPTYQSMNAAGLPACPFRTDDRLNSRRPIRGYLVLAQCHGMGTRPVPHVRSWLLLGLYIEH